jgi:hypothetical protein
MKIFYRFISLIVTIPVLILVGCGGTGIDPDTRGEPVVNSEQTASTAISGYQVVTQDTSLSNSVSKQLEVLCGPDTKVLGAGWAVLNSTNIILDGKATYSTPIFDGSGWVANAELRNHSNIEWKLRVSLLCAPESALTGYQIITGETPANNSSSKSLSLSCPTDKKPVGAGWGTLDPTGAILPGQTTYSMPGYDGSTWQTNAICSASWTDWKLKSSLICVDSESLPNYQIITADTDLSDLSLKQLSLLCPSGKKVTSAGWGVLDSTSVILPGSALYHLPKYNGSGWTINAIENVTWPWDELWKLRVRLICID